MGIEKKATYSKTIWGPCTSGWGQEHLVFWTRGLIRQSTLKFSKF